MRHFDVVECEGVFGIELSDGAFKGITVGDVPFSVGHSWLLPGWRPEKIHTGFHSVAILTLAHVHGGRASWYLNDDLNFLANSADGLDPAVRDIFLQQLAPLVAGLWKNIMNVEHGSGARLKDFAALTGVLGPDVTALLADRLAIEPMYAHADQLRALSTPLTFFHRGEALEITPERADQLFQTTGFDIALNTTRNNGTLRLSPPYADDGRTVECCGCLPLTPYLAVYSFFDPQNNLPFQVIAGSHICTVTAVYFPEQGLLLESSGFRSLIKMLFNRPIHAVLLQHILRYAELILPYKDDAAKSTVLFFKELHLGHHLWNELTAVHRLIAEAPGQNFLKIHMLERRSETFGPLEHLFPVLAGKIDRSIDGFDAFIEHSYRTGCIGVRPCQNYVSRDLARTILETCSQYREVVAERERNASLLERSGPVIVIGFRLENRTVIDFFEFTRDLIAFLLSKFPQAIFVLDGHNRMGEEENNPVLSHGEWLASESVSGKEMQIAAKLQETFNTAERVVVVSNIMASVPINLFWLAQGAFFIAPWGAGLAKYRWIANLPGFVLTNVWNLRHRPDLDIYHSPVFMEDPAPLVLGSENTIQTDVNAKRIISLDHGVPSDANFHVVRETFFGELNAFLNGLPDLRAVAR